MNSGLTFSYVDAGGVTALGAALPAVCLVVVALRFYTRQVQGAELKTDDWLSVGALLAVIGMGACLIAGARLRVMGFATPDPPSDLSEDQEEYYLDPVTRLNQIIEYPFQILLVLGYGFIKMSILFFYRRIFVTRRKTAVDVFLILMIVAVALWTFSFEMLVIFNCGTHVWANWSSPGWQSTYCPTGHTSEYGLVTSDLILDVLIFVVPIPLVWRLEMSTKRKLAVIGIFLLAASAVGASIARLILYFELLNAIAAGAAVDPNLGATLGYYWSLLEAGLALIAACMPPMAYLFTHRHEILGLERLRNGMSSVSLRHLGISRRSETARTMSEEAIKAPHSAVDEIMPAKPRAAIRRTVSIDMEHHPRGDGHPTDDANPAWYPGLPDETQYVR